MIVSWMTTNKCNLRCEHCYQDAADCDSRELTTVEGKATVSYTHLTLPTIRLV